MKDGFRKLLIEADEPGCYEFPSNFDYDSLERSARIVETEIFKKLGEKTKFEGAAHNQDASFSIAIIFEGRQTLDNGMICQPSIRFSNFGRLASISSPIPFSESDYRTIVDIVEAAGFHYIPDDALDSPYDGIMAGDKSLPTWWVRYFDWL